MRKQIRTIMIFTLLGVLLLRFLLPGREQPER